MSKVNVFVSGQLAHLKVFRRILDCEQLGHSFRFLGERQ